MRLALVLQDLAQHLRQLDLSFAVVGGIATSARGEPRFTRDVDVAVAVAGDEEAERVIFQLSQRGYVFATTVEQDAVGRLATARLLHPSGIMCDSAPPAHRTNAHKIRSVNFVPVARGGNSAWNT